LGTASFPKLHSDASTEHFPSAASSRERLSDEETSPLLAGRPSLVAEDDANQFFTQALDEQLNIVVPFYSKKETSLRNDVEKLIKEVHDIEAFDRVISHHGPGHLQLGNEEKAHVRQRRARALSDTFASTSFLSDDNPVTVNISVQDPFRDHYTSLLWQSKALKIERRTIKTTATALYVALCELRGYVELNYTGFNKILKKYEKVTGFKLKREYLATKVEHAYPFKHETKIQLSAIIEKVVGIYARVITDNKMNLALTELNNHLKEQLVWERNTIWRDMIEKERRGQAVELVSASTKVDSPGKAFLYLTEWNFCGISLSLPSLKCKFMKLLYATGIFASLLSVPFFESVEQNNCLAILVYASLMWAFEVLLLLVTDN
jgi:phosphate transporter